MRVFIPKNFINQLYYYEDILKGIESINTLKDPYIFLHFSLPGSREIDIVVITGDSIQLIEVKKETFSEISTNDSWKMIKNGKERKYEKFIGINKILENPYQQATNTSDEFKKWIVRNSKILVSQEFKEFAKTDHFKVFPNVFIIKSKFLNSENIQFSKWCFIAHGLNELPSILHRSWKSNYIYEEDILELSEKLGLIEHSSKIKKLDTKPNQTLSDIISYLWEYNVSLDDVNVIQEKVFDSGIRPKLVIGALQRGERDKLLILKEEGYFLTEDVKVFLSEGYSVSDLLDIWPSFMKINQIKVLDPRFWRVIQQTSSDSLDLNKKPNQLNIIEKIPEELLAFNFLIISMIDPKDPFFFRKGGVTFTEYKSNIIPYIYDKEGNNLVIEIFTLLKNGKNILLQGHAGTCKTTLVKLIGFELIKENFAVLYIDPGFIDRSLTNVLFQFDETDNKNEQLFVIIENIHLANPEEIQQLKLILRKYKKISLIITSRKESIISLTGENILEPFFDENQGRYFNLDESIDFESLLSNLFLKIKSTFLNKIDNEQIEQLKQIIFENSETDFSLKLLKLQGIMNYLLQDQFTINGLKVSELTETQQKEAINKIQELKDENKQKIIEKLILGQFEAEIKLLENHTIPVITIEKILFLCYALSSLEVSIDEQLIMKLTGISKDEVRKIILLLDSLGIFNKMTSESYIIPHPEYSKELVKAIEKDYMPLKEFIQNFSNDSSNTKDSDFTSVLIYKIKTINPIAGEKILTNLKLEKDEAIEEQPLPSLTELVENVDTYILDEFMYLFRKLTRTFYYEYTNLVRRILDSISEEKWIDLIHSSESFSAIQSLIQEFNIYQYPKTFSILNKINIDFLTELLINNQDIAYNDTGNWNWANKDFFQLKLILRKFFDNNLLVEMEFPEVSEKIFRIVDDLDINDVLTKFEDITIRKLMDVYNFLNETSKKYNQRSKLFKLLIEYYLNLELDEININLIIVTFVSLNPDDDYHKKIFEESKQNLDLRKLSTLLKKLSIIDLLDVYQFLFSFDKQLYIDFDKNFTVEEIKQLILLDYNAPDSHGYWFNFLIKMNEMKFQRLPTLLEYLGFEFFKDLIEVEYNRYAPIPILKLIFDNDWSEKNRLLETIDFIPILGKHYIRERICLYLNQFIPERLEKFGEIIFKEALITKEDSYFEISHLIALSEKLHWPWMEWINTEVILEYINNHKYDQLYNFEELFKELNEHGWEAPKDLKNALKEKEYIFEQELLERMDNFHKIHRYLQKNETDKALTILRNEIPLIKDYEDYHKFVGIIRKFSENLAKELVNLLKPEQILEISKNDRDYQLIVIFKLLIEYDYPYLADCLVYVIINNPREISYLFRDGSDITIPDLVLEEVVSKLFEKREYFSVFFVTRNKTELIQTYQDVIINHLIDYSEIDPYLLKIFELINKEIELHDLINNFLQAKRLTDLILVLSAKNVINTINEYINQIKELDRDLVKSIVNNSSLPELDLFFNFVNDNNGNKVVKNWINKLSKEEWDYYLENKDELEVKLFYSWF